MPQKIGKTVGIHFCKNVLSEINLPLGSGPKAKLSLLRISKLDASCHFPRLLNVINREITSNGSEKKSQSVNIPKHWMSINTQITIFETILTDLQTIF